MVMKIMIAAVYAVYAAFWIRFALHALLWVKATRRSPGYTDPAFRQTPASRIKACALTAGDVLFFGRLLRANALLWFGEWIFHLSLLVVLLRHLRYFLNPVPEWVWSVQTAGIIAGYILPFSLVYILIVRLLTGREKYRSPLNFFLLSLLLAISGIGVLMREVFTPNIVSVKEFITGVETFKPAAPPDSVFFMAHFVLVLVLAMIVPTHLFSAPFVMMEARKREQRLDKVMHEK